MSFRQILAPAVVSIGTGPVPSTTWTGLTLGHLSRGKTEHGFKVDAAKEALFTMPVSTIEGVISILNGTITPAQTNQLYQHLSEFAKAQEVGLGFHNSAKNAEVAVTDRGNVYTQPGSGLWKKVYGQSTGGSDDADDESSRVYAYVESSPAMFDEATTDVTTSGVDNDSEHAYVHIKVPGKVYASFEPFTVRHANPGKDNQPTTIQYSHVVTRIPLNLGGGYVLIAKR